MTLNRVTFLSWALVCHKPAKPLDSRTEKYAEGLQRLKQVVHHGGHTSIGDLATGCLISIPKPKPWPSNWRVTMYHSALALSFTALDLRRVAVTRRRSCHGEALLSHNTHRLSFARHIKLFSDGAFFSQLAQMQEPGYIDGHHGEWLAAPEELSGISAPTGSWLSDTCTLPAI